MFLFNCIPVLEDFFGDFAVDVGQTEVTASMAIS